MLEAIVLIAVFSAGAVITIGIVGLQLRARLKAIEVLKIYADRGEAPPDSVIETINRIGAASAAPALDRECGRRLLCFASAAGLSLGGWAIVLWRALVAPRDPDWPMIAALAVGVVFAALALYAYRRAA